LSLSLSLLQLSYRNSPAQEQNHGHITGRRPGRGGERRHQVSLESSKFLKCPGRTEKTLNPNSRPRPRPPKKQVLPAGLRRASAPSLRPLQLGGRGLQRPSLLYDRSLRKGRLRARVGDRGGRGFRLQRRKQHRARRRLARGLPAPDARAQARRPRRGGQERQGVRSGEGLPRGEADEAAGGYRVLRARALLGQRQAQQQEGAFGRAHQGPGARPRPADDAALRDQRRAAVAQRLRRPRVAALPVPRRDRGRERVVLVGRGAQRGPESGPRGREGRRGERRVVLRPGKRGFSRCPCSTISEGF
jgi:hypothetical protein